MDITRFPAGHSFRPSLFETFTSIANGGFLSGAQHDFDDAAQPPHRAAMPVSRYGVAFEAVQRFNPLIAKTALGGEIGDHRRQESLQMFRPRLWEADDPKPIAQRAGQGVECVC